MKLIAIFFFSIIFFSVATTTCAQPFMVQGVAPRLYIVHISQPKETLYQLAIKYNLSSAAIASYNKWTLDKKIAAKQSIKIPLTPVNFYQQITKTTQVQLTPIYHIVAAKEWAFRICANYNKLPIAHLEKWNNIKANAIKPGMKLIIGYLRRNDLQVEAKENISKEHAVASSALDKSTQKETVVKEIKTVGVFKTLFVDRKKTIAGTAGMFKSISGWQDKKYYALINKIPIGTIVKLSLPTSTKAVYAKVLGGLPIMKESKGLVIRMSDAAAKELGATTDRFEVEVRF
jgi:LysM repeat protein